MTDTLPNLDFSSKGTGVTDEHAAKAGIVAGIGLLTAIGASSCCILPLALFSLGIGGAWIGQLAALSPYQPYFILITLGFLGYGYWLVYWKPVPACSSGQVCARPLSKTVVRYCLWLATALVLLAFAWPVLVPLILG